MNDGMRRLRDGTRMWYRRGLLYREDGPAIEWNHGTKEWYRDSNRVREDGPVLEGGTWRYTESPYSPWAKVP